MMRRVWENVRDWGAALWCHRVAYAGLACVYGAGCAGWVDKDTVAQIATGMYLVMSAQRH